MKTTSILLTITTLVSLLETVFGNEFGLFCNPIQGCGNSSLTCIKNRCECAPGYAVTSNYDSCQWIGCETNGDCQDLDPNRLCNNTNGTGGTCNLCKDGLVLDPVLNRCVTLIGHGCTRSSECFATTSTYERLIRDLDSLPICRSGRCVCRTDYFPNEDWTRCELRNCSSKEACNPFGDDPYRFCSKTHRRCLCNMGYYENTNHSICLPYIPIQYSLMMPFWLTMIMFTVCILVYISRRLARARAVANAEEAAAAAASEESGATPHVLNLPPPSYDTVVKEPVAEAAQTDSQPPTYSTLSTQA